MRGVLQTDFSAGAGNALQACVASILELPLDAVPNFIQDKEGYLVGINRFVAAHDLVFSKLPCSDDAVPWSTAGGNDAMPVPCVVAGRSPRGDFKHCVVGLLKGGDITFAHDPHPDGTMLEDKQWVGLFVAASPKVK